MDRTHLRKTDDEADGDYALGVGCWCSGPTNGVAEYGSVAMDEVGDPASAQPAGSSTRSTPAQLLEVARRLIDGDPAVLSDALHSAQVTAQVGRGCGDDRHCYGYGVFVCDGFNVGESCYLERLVEHGGNPLDAPARRARLRRPPALDADSDAVELDGYWQSLSFLGADPGQPTPWMRNRAFVGTRVDDAGQALTGAAPADPDEARARIDRQLSLARGGPPPWARDALAQR